MKEKEYYYTAGNLRRELNEVNKITEQRTEEDNFKVMILSWDLNNYRKRMINYLLEALLEMTQKLHDGVVDEEIVQKYDSLFIIESLNFGGR